MNNEFVKNSNRLLASKFFGILAAVSFTVSSKCNLFTNSFCKIVITNRKEEVNIVLLKTKPKRYN